MPLFKQKECPFCGLDTAKAGIQPNPDGRYFCPVCSRELTPIEPKKKAPSEPEPEPEAGAPEAKPEPETPPSEE